MKSLIVFGLSSFLLLGCDDTNPNKIDNGDLAGPGLPDLATPITPGGDLAMPPSGDLAMAVPCTCPQGFSCDSSGQCAGGDPTKLQLDVKTIKVSGTVTINGAAPVLTAQCTPTTVEAVVHLVDQARGHSFDIPILCSATSAAFDAVVFPGDYKVTVTGDATLSELPAAPFPLPILSVSADRTGIALDVKMVSLDGTVTLNSAVPMVAQCDTQVTVELVPTGMAGSFFDLSAPCATPLVWSGKVYPGSYNVTVLNVGDVTNSGNQAFTVTAALDASTDKHNIALDVKTFNVGGPVTLDTKTPSAADCTAVNGAQVAFTENKSGLTATTSAQCVTNALKIAPFRLFAGEYTVTIFGNGTNPLLSQQYPIRDKFQLTHDQITETFDVSTAAAKLFNVGGTITLNGHAPVDSASCSFRKASVVFENSKKVSTSFDIMCGAGNSFTGMLPADTYDVFVFDPENGSDLLAPGFPAATAFVLGADKTNFAFDEKTVMVAGRVTLDGQDPATVGTCNTGSSQFEGTVHLSQKDGPTFNLPIPCSAGIFAWSGSVYPGSYTVSVDGLNGSSSLPDESFKLAAAVDTSAAGSLKIDVLTTNVAGKVTLNGMAPSTTTQCNSNPNQHKATVTLFNIDQEVSFALPVLCSSTDFSWNGVVFPGTYRISVSGAGGFSSLPKNDFLAVPKLKIQ